MMKMMKMILKGRPGRVPETEGFHSFQKSIFGRRRLLWT